VWLCLLFFAWGLAGKLQNAWTSGLYTASQDPAGNNVLVYGVSPNGSVWFVQEVTNGPWSGGPTHNQGSIVIVRNLLFVVNPPDDSVSLFSINSTNPTDVKYQDSTVCLCSGPTVLAGTEAWGGFVVSVSSGVGAVTLTGYYTQDNTGSYTLARNWTMALNITLDNTTVLATSGAAFSPDNDYFVIQFKGLPNVAVVVISVYPNGTFSDTPKMYPPTSPLGAASFGFTFFGDNWIVGTDAKQGVNIYEIDAGGVVNKTSPTPWVVGKGALAYCWSTSSNLTNDVFAIAARSGNITEVSITSNLITEAKTVATNWMPITDAVTTSQMSDASTNEGGTQSLFVLSPGHGIGQITIKGVGSLTVGGVTPFPKTNTNLTNVAGLAAYSVWSLETINSSSAGCLHPSLMLVALLLFFSFLN